MEAIQEEHQGPVGGQHVRWLLDLCKRRGIPERQLLNHVPVDASRLRQEDARITWESMALIYANVGSWFADEDIIRAGADAWKHMDFRYWLTQAALHGEPRDQITSLLLDPTGIFRGLPLSASVSRSTAEVVMVDVTSRHPVPAPRALLGAIAGQLAFLPAVLGNQPAEANLVESESVNHLEFWLPGVNRLARLRRRLVLPRFAPFLASHAQRLTRALIDAERDRVAARQLAEEAQQLAADRAGEIKRLREQLAQELDYRNRVKDETRAASQELQTLIANVAEAVIHTDADGRITDFNEATPHIFGADNAGLAGVHITRLIPGALQLPAGTRAHPATGVSGSRALTLLANTFARGTPDENGRIWIIRDLTDMTDAERERAELYQQLQATQRVESLGELTGGIAHDFNNLLVAINGYAELGLGRNDVDAISRGQFEEIRRAGARAADLTQKLLTFARRQEVEFARVDLNGLVRDVENMIRRLLPANIHVRFLQSLYSPCVLADAGQLEQVLVNLCVNARDAMPEGGRLTISVNKRSQKDAAGNLSERAIVTVEDTGTGIPSGIAEKIFEPFFTTKSRGEGTGLGLSVVFGIIKRHGGTIELDSRPGRGSRFDILLPLAPTGFTAVREGAAPYAPTPGVDTRTGTILLIEDNEQVRKLSAQILEASGYAVIAAADGSRGISTFEHHARDIDAVIVDLVLPDKGGREVFEAISGQRPDVPVLFSTGYSIHSNEAGFIRERHLDIIEKPYTPERLRRKLAELLDRD